MVDIYHSRRGKFKLAKYWLRDEDTKVGDLSVYVLKNKPTGQFYCSEVSNTGVNKQQVNNVIIYDSSQLTLETNDDIDGVAVGTVIQYQNHAWRVVSMQKQLHKRENEFGVAEWTTYLTIQR